MNERILSFSLFEFGRHAYGNVGFLIFSFGTTCNFSRALLSFHIDEGESNMNYCLGFFFRQYYWGHKKGAK